LAREAGALYDQGVSLLTMAQLDFYAGRLAEARAHVREVIELFTQTGARLLLINCLELCADLCAATRRWREAIIVWAAFAAVRATWIQGESQADRRSAFHQHPHRPLPSRPDPGQDRQPAPRRPDPSGAAGGPRLAAPPLVGRDHDPGGRRHAVGEPQRERDAIGEQAVPRSQHERV